MVRLADPSDCVHPRTRRDEDQCALLLTSRQDFTLKEKKLSCALLVVGMALAMGGWEAEDNTVPGWRQPIFVLLSVGGGCLCAFVFSLVPIPGVSENLNPMRAFALSEATARLNFSLNAVQTLLETHISLVVRAEPAELIQAEVVNKYCDCIMSLRSLNNNV